MKILLLIFISFNVFAEKLNYEDLIQAFSGKYILIETDKIKACFSIDKDVKVVEKSNKCDLIKKIIITDRGAVCIVIKSKKDCRKVRVLPNGNYAFGGAKHPITIYNSIDNLVDYKISNQSPVKVSTVNNATIGQNKGNALKPSWNLPKFYKSEAIQSCIKDMEESKLQRASSILDIEKRDFCKCVSSQPPYFFESFSDYIDMAIKDKKNFLNIAAKMALKCAVKLDEPNTSQSDNELWSLLDGDRRLHISNCETSINSIPEVKNRINNFNIRIKDFCSCTADEMPQQFDSLNDYLLAEDHSLRSVTGKCMIKALPKDKISWKFTEPLRLEFVKDCVNSSPMKLSSGLAPSDVCSCAADEIPKKFKSYDEFILQGEYNKVKAQNVMVQIASQCMLSGGKATK